LTEPHFSLPCFGLHQYAVSIPNTSSISRTGLWPLSLSICRKIGIGGFRAFDLKAVFQVSKDFIIKRVNKPGLLDTGNFYKIAKP
jgi:hypothetical protein